VLTATERAAVVPTRIPGRGRLLFALRGLLRRVQRYAAHRAMTRDDLVWASALADDLDGALARALSAPGARAAVDAVDQRRAASRKTQTP
jgi:hypothetical protein